MNENLVKRINPFETPSVDAQIYEERARSSIVQRADIKILNGGNGGLHVHYSPIANQGLVDLYSSGPKEWLEKLPEPRWKNALKDIILMAVEMCGNETKAAKFLGVTRRVINYRFKAKQKCQLLRK